MIEEHAPAVLPAWDSFVARCPDATCHQLSGWSQVATRAYGLRARLLISRESSEGPVRGVLPLFVVPRPFHHYVTTGVFGAYGKVLADGPATSELLDAARAFTDREGAQYLHVKGLGDGPAPCGFARQDLWVRALLPLRGGADAVWSRFKSSMRAAIRQGRAAGLELREGHGELEAFHDVLADNMHRLGSPIYGLRFFRAALDAFGDRVNVFTLRKEGVPISGALTIAFNGVMNVPFASSRKAFFPMRPNNLLYWSIIERACALGLETLDFGSSMRNSSALAFKLGWRAVTEPVASYVYAHDGGTPDLGPGAAGLQAGVELWKRLPGPVADALGPMVARFMV
jgi:FemAB-related protein (PEP-CTERM system-associated)